LIIDTPKNRDFAKAASPLNWYEVAKLLHDNAHQLHNSLQGQITYYEGNKTITRKTSNRSVFLLAAFSLENLIKAFLVLENPQYIENGRLSKQLLNGHSLTKLQMSCKKIPSPKRTKNVFEVLEIGINSWARYPCGTSADKETPEKSMTDELWLAYNKVFNLYSKRLEVLLSKRWRGAYGEIGYVVFDSF
jgi:hypothetical protein